MRACLHAGISITGEAPDCVLICRYIARQSSLQHAAVGRRTSAADTQISWRCRGCANACFGAAAASHQWGAWRQGVVFLLAGAQAEPVPGQWSYSLGPCSGIDFADQLWMSRFILHRLAEHFQLVASLDPKPVRSLTKSEQIWMPSALLETSVRWTAHHS